MSKELLERLDGHPELRKHIETMLDIAEDVTGTLKKADDAEIQVVSHIRKLGASLLHEWAVQQEKKTIEHWKQNHPESEGHGKKKSTGKLRLVV